MAIRRVLAANIGGKSQVIDDTSGITNAFVHVEGFDPALLWKAAPGSQVSVPEIPQSGQNVMPEKGGTSLMIVTFPPDAYMAQISDPEAAGAEYMARIPGLAETFEPDAPGMHTTPTMDYGIVLEGEVVCVFDEGEVVLKAGDVLVQSHTRHGWSNRTNVPAKVAFVLIG